MLHDQGLVVSCSGDIRFPFHPLLVTGYLNLSFICRGPIFKTRFITRVMIALCCVITPSWRSMHASLPSKWINPPPSSKRRSKVFFPFAACPCNPFGDLPLQHLVCGGHFLLPIRSGTTPPALCHNCFGLVWPVCLLSHNACLFSCVPKGTWLSGPPPPFWKYGTNKSSSISIYKTIYLHSL